MRQKTLRGVTEWENALTGTPHFTYTRSYHSRPAAYRHAFGMKPRPHPDGIIRMTFDLNGLSEEYIFVRHFVEEATEWKESP
jgi:hypothetical protein